MRLDVCLAHHVQAVLVAQFQEHSIVGIVARAHRIAIVLLHRNDVGAHILASHCFAAYRMMVVTIHTTNGDSPIVYSYLAGFHTNPSKPGDKRCVLPLGPEQLYHHAIALWVLGRPRANPGNGEFRGYVVTSENVWFRMPMGNVVHDGLADALAGELFTPHLDCHTR